MFRLIENRTAANPFYHEAIAVHLYTLDELCYFLKTHMYLIDRDWFGEELFSWLGRSFTMRRWRRGCGSVTAVQKIFSGVRNRFCRRPGITGRRRWSRFISC